MLAQATVRKISSAHHQLDQPCCFIKAAKGVDVLGLLDLLHVGHEVAPALPVGGVDAGSGKDVLVIEEAGLDPVEGGLVPVAIGGAGLVEHVVLEGVGPALAARLAGCDVGVGQVEDIVERHPPGRAALVAGVELLPHDIGRLVGGHAGGQVGFEIRRPRADSGTSSISTSGWAASYSATNSSAILAVSGSTLGSIVALQIDGQLLLVAGGGRRGAGVGGRRRPCHRRRGRVRRAVVRRRRSAPWPG